MQSQTGTVDDRDPYKTGYIYQWSTMRHGRPVFVRTNHSTGLEGLLRRVLSPSDGVVDEAYTSGQRYRGINYDSLQTLSGKRTLETRFFSP